MEIKDDHVHLFLSAPPRYSPAEIVQVIKSISGKMVFREFPEIKKQLWGGEFWSDGYFVRSVGDKVTSEIIRRYIKYQQQEQLGFEFYYPASLLRGSLLNKFMIQYTSVLSRKFV
jgi:putative transposase